MTTYETKTENIARGYQEGKWVYVTATYDSGKNRVIDAFEGVIDYVAMDEKAGRPCHSAENYKVIEWLGEYHVSYLPTGQDCGMTERRWFGTLEDAVKFYLEYDSVYKVLHQMRKLEDGTIDSNVVTYF